MCLEGEVGGGTAVLIWDGRLKMQMSNCGVFVW